MSNELKVMKEPSIGSYLIIGLSIGVGLGTIVASLNNFLINNAFIEASSLIKFLMLLRLILPSLGALTAYALYRHKYKLYMRSKYMHTDF